MRPTPENLADSSQFVLIGEIAHEDIIPSIQAYLRLPSPVRTAYWLVNALILGSICTLWYATKTPLIQSLPNLCSGMALGYILILPVHEWVHALTYRWLGAGEVKVVYRWRNMTAYCVADRFVVSMREFVGICLAPFVLVNAALVVAIAVVGGFWPVLWGMLLLHVGACSGDIAFVNLAWIHRGEQVSTYDDVAKARSFFFARRP